MFNIKVTSRRYFSKESLEGPLQTPKQLLTLDPKIVQLAEQTYLWKARNCILTKSELEKNTYLV